MYSSRHMGLETTRLRTMKHARWEEVLWAGGPPRDSRSCSDPVDDPLDEVTTANLSPLTLPLMSLSTFRRAFSPLGS
jgi:hypothetical protein